MRRLILASSAIAVLTLLCQPRPLLAQPVYHGGAIEAKQHGFEHGYRDGFSFGQSSQVSNRDQDIVNQRLRQADRDYESGFGSQDLYREGYSEGFRAGMQDGRAGSRSRLEDMFRSKQPNYDPDRNRDDRIDGIYAQNHWQPRHAAGDIGYRDGVDAGVRDRLEGHSYAPRKHEAWRNGMHGFDEDYHAPRGQYRQAYRESYEAGYRDGFARAR